MKTIYLPYHLKYASYERLAAEGYVIGKVVLREGQMIIHEKVTMKV